MQIHYKQTNCRNTHMVPGTHMYTDHHTSSGCESRLSVHTSVSAKMIKQMPPLCIAALIKLSCMCPSEKEIQESAFGGAKIYLPC